MKNQGILFLVITLLSLQPTTTLSIAGHTRAIIIHRLNKMLKAASPMSAAQYAQAIALINKLPSVDREAKKAYTGEANDNYHQATAHQQFTAQAQELAQKINDIQKLESNNSNLNEQNSTWAQVLDNRLKKVKDKYHAWAKHPNTSFGALLDLAEFLQEAATGIPDVVTRSTYTAKIEQLERQMVKHQLEVFQQELQKAVALFTTINNYATTIIPALAQSINSTTDPQSILNNVETITNEFFALNITNTLTTLVKKLGNLSITHELTLQALKEEPKWNTDLAKVIKALKLDNIKNLLLAIKGVREEIKKDKFKNLPNYPEIHSSMLVKEQALYELLETADFKKIIAELKLFKKKKTN